MVADLRTKLRLGDAFSFSLVDLAAWDKSGACGALVLCGWFEESPGVPPCPRGRALIPTATPHRTGTNFTNLPHTRLALLNATRAPNVTAAMAYDLGDTVRGPAPAGLALSD